MPLSPYRHFERTREIFFVRGQAKAVRGAGNGKHRASCDWGSRCFMQTDLRRKTANGKRKRSLGCARDDETRKRFPPIPFQSTAGSQPPPLRTPPFRGRRENALFLHRHFERKREIFFVRGQAKAVREAGNGKHRASCDWGVRCFMQTDLRRKTANGKRKRSLGCARDDETRKRFPPIPFQSTAGSQPLPLRSPPFRGRRKNALFPYRHFERTREIFFVRGREKL